MKLVVLTTQTLHHTFFVKELGSIFPVTRVFSETKAVQPPFATHHAFEEERDVHEAQGFFNGQHPGLKEFADTSEFPSMNDPAATALLKKIQPDVAVVFGTGKLSEAVIRICPDGIINLHGGDPEYYRGLDSHLWAIYHSDFDALTATLHTVNVKLDDGSIILQTRLALRRGMTLSSLRAHTTRACIQLTGSALDMLARFGHFLSRKQRRTGRYYSFMPAELKSVCVEKFETFTAAL